MTAFVVNLGWPMFVRIIGPAYARWAGGVEITLAVAFLAAPILALLPIPVVSTIIQASPLSLKFILAGELRATIHERTFAD